MKVMISQPMAGKNKYEVEADRDRAVSLLIQRGHTVVQTLYSDEWYKSLSEEEKGELNLPLAFVAKSLETMSKCDAVYFCKGWETARGCKLEFQAATSYGLKIMLEE